MTQIDKDDIWYANKRRGEESTEDVWAVYMAMCNENLALRTARGKDRERIAELRVKAARLLAALAGYRIGALPLAELDAASKSLHDAIAPEEG